MTEEKKVSTGDAAVAEKKKTAQKAAKKPNAFVNFFKKIGKFFADCRVEMKNIVWSSPSSTLKNTILVTIAVIVFTAVFYGLDFLFRDILIGWLQDLPRYITNLF